MPRFRVSVTEKYVQMVDVEAPTPEEAQDKAQALWDAGKVQPTEQRNSFRGVEVWAEEELPAEASPEVN
jgi:hypothetical protein